MGNAASTCLSPADRSRALWSSTIDGVAKPSRRRRGSSSSEDDDEDPDRNKKHAEKQRRQKLLENINNQRFNECDPETSIELLKIPIVPNYMALRKLIENAPRAWMEKFLSINGVAILFDKLEKLSFANLPSEQLSNAVLQTEIAYAIRAVMNSQIGLEFMLTHRELSRQLLSTISSTKNTLLKQIVLELFSAMSIYSPKGYQAAIDALDYFKASTSKLFRTSIIVGELAAAETDKYRATVLCFANCLLAGTGDVWFRHSLRFEMITIGLLSHIEKCRVRNHNDILIQIQAFEQLRAKDEAELNVNEEKCLFDIFCSLFLQIKDKPQAIAFYEVLHNLSKLDINNPNYRFWQMLDNITKEAAEGHVFDWGLLGRIMKIDDRISVEVQTDAQADGQLWLKTSYQSVCVQTETVSISTTSEGLSIIPAADSPLFPDKDKASKPAPEIKPAITNPTPASPKPENLPQKPISASTPVSPNSPATVPLPPPPLPGGISSIPPVPSKSTPSLPMPPPLPGGISGIPPPPPAGGQSGPPPPPPPGFPSGPPPPPGFPSGPPPPPGFPSGPPPPPGFPSGAPAPPGGQPSLAAVPVAKPKGRLKKLYWSKITNVKNSVWEGVNVSLRENPPLNLQFDQIEELFGMESIKTPGTPAAVKEEKIETPAQDTTITVLDRKRSLSVNIFLKQFKCPSWQIVEWLEKFDTVNLNAERLRFLEKILPEKEEIISLKSYRKEANKLGVPEQFLLKLIDLPAYAMRISIILLKNDFEPSIQELETPLSLVFSTCRAVLENKSLKDFIAVVLHVGNFLNSDSNAGNAVGFRLNVLVQLTDLKANKPGMTLLHYLVALSNQNNPNLLNFTTELATVKKARSVDVEYYAGELRNWTQKVKDLDTQISSATPEIQSQAKDFLVVANKKLAAIKALVADVENVTKDLASHFGEIPARFKLTELFGLLSDVIDKTESARKENELRKKQEERAAAQEAEKLQRANNNDQPAKDVPHKDVTKKASNKKQNPPPKDEPCLIDRLLGEIRKGEFKLRSFNKDQEKSSDDATLTLPQSST